MRTPSGGKSAEQPQNDPGVSNNPEPARGSFDLHAWTTLSQIFDRLGQMDQKINQLTTEQSKLSESVEKHDKIILRAIFTAAGAIGIIVACWFLYDNLLKDHLTLK